MSFVAFKRQRAVIKKMNEHFKNYLVSWMYIQFHFGYLTDLIFFYALKILADFLHIYNYFLDIIFYDPELKYFVF